MDKMPERWEEWSIAFVYADKKMEVWTHPSKMRAFKQWEAMHKWNPSAILFQGKPTRKTSVVQRTAPLLSKEERQEVLSRIASAETLRGFPSVTLDEWADLFAQLEKDDYWVQFAVFPEGLEAWEDPRWDGGDLDVVWRWGALCFTSPHVQHVHLVGVRRLSEDGVYLSDGAEYKVIRGRP